MRGFRHCATSPRLRSVWPIVGCFTPYLADSRTQGGDSRKQGGDSGTQGGDGNAHVCDEKMSRLVPQDAFAIIREHLRKEFDRDF
jgi:hypothetical protein